MHPEEHPEDMNKRSAAMCGLYGETCSWFIATTEEPARLKRLAAQFHVSEEESSCYGCCSMKRLPYGENCTMFACAAERGINFCTECEEYPCDGLRHFQAAMPHRIEVWDNLEHIQSIGYRQWLTEVRGNHFCPEYHVINSAYDPTCRNCAAEPSCWYVGKHKREIEQYVKNR